MGSMFILAVRSKSVVTPVVKQGSTDPSLILATLDKHIVALALAHTELGRGMNRADFLDDEGYGVYQAQHLDRMERIDELITEIKFIKRSVEEQMEQPRNRGLEFRIVTSD